MSKKKSHIRSPHQRRQFKQRLYASQNGKCATCGKPVGLAFILLAEGWTYCPMEYYLRPPVGSKEPQVRVATLDHVVARYNGGSNCFENMQLLCKTCNERKGYS